VAGPAISPPTRRPRPGQPKRPRRGLLVQALIICLIVGAANKLAAKNDQDLQR
jgi:hypothetical protein